MISIRKKATEQSTNVFVRDSLPLVNTQEFMQTIALLPFNNQSTPIVGDSLTVSNSSLSDLISLLS